MTQSEKSTSHKTFDPAVWLNRQGRHLTKHWLLAANLLAAAFVTLPYAAPILMSQGYHRPANLIYGLYRVTCHQLPERSYFVFGHQAALCQRCTAIWAALFIGGLIFIRLRYKLKPLPFHWWILALIPIGLDGGTQLVGPLYEVLPGWGLSGFALIVWLGLTGLLGYYGVSKWQYYLFVLCFPLGMIFVQFTGTRLSNWQLRTLTGTLFGLAHAWLLFPMFEALFQEARQRMAYVSKG